MDEDFFGDAVPARRECPPVASAEISAAELAELLGIETSELARLARAGTVPPPETRGVYRLKPAVRGFIAKLRDKRELKPKERLDAVRADREEVELRKATGELIARAAAQKILVSAAAAARRQLETIPERVAPQLAECSVPAVCAEILAKEIAAALEALADDEMSAERMRAEKLNGLKVYSPADAGEKDCPSLSAPRKD